MSTSVSHLQNKRRGWPDVYVCHSYPPLLQRWQSEASCQGSGCYSSPTGWHCALTERNWMKHEVVDYKSKKKTNKKSMISLKSKMSFRSWVCRTTSKQLHSYGKSNYGPQIPQPNETKFKDLPKNLSVCMAVPYKQVYELCYTIS